MLFICLIVSIDVFSQYIFRHLDIVDGLSDNQIRSLSMTPDGRLGVRTASILNLYNGATFEHFYQDRKKEYTWSYTRPPKEYYDIEGRIWMKETGYLLLLDLNTNQFVYTIEEELKSLGIYKKLKNIFIDDYKNYWFITEDNTFSFYDISKKELMTITAGDSEFTKKFGVPRELAQYKNLCWIVYTSGIICCWDYTSEKFVFQYDYFLNTISDATDRIYIHPTSTGDIWLMHNFAVSFYNWTDKSWTKVATISGISNFFTCMDIDMNGNVWVGTSLSGLRYIDCNTFQVETIAGLKIDKGGISNNDIYTVFADDYNGVWVGTLFQGLYYYHPSMQKFQLIQTIYNETLITNEIVRCFLEDKDGSILVGTANGLFRFYPNTRKTEKVFPELINGLCLSLYRDSRNRIWVGTFLNGFYCIDGPVLKNYNHSFVNTELYPNQNISRAIYEDSAGRYWVSVRNEGVGKFNVQTGEISVLYKRFPKVEFHKIDYNFYPIDDNSFAVVGEKGIYYYNPETDSLWIPELDDPENPKFRDLNTKYYCMFKDSRSLEWFGTELGIRVWDNEKKRLYKMDVDDGLPNNTISAILEDDDGLLWVSSANGITRIEVKKTSGNYEFSFLNFNTYDGLQSGKFYDRSSLKAGNGYLYFGGIHGFNTFNPQKIVYNQSKNKPIFTSLKLFNSLIKENIAYNGHIILEQPLNRTQKILLNYKENFITLEFAGLNYVNPSQTYFRYKLENFDQEWNEIHSNGLGTVTYTGLQPGTYRLIVYTANNDKIWGDEAAIMTIVITPPFWTTVYAYIFYSILLILVVYSFFIQISKRNRQKMIEKQIIEKRKQKEELDQMKFRFFTNISHEFRAPLTLIMTPLDTLIRQQKDVQLKQKLTSIYRNASDMLSLINQLLDFRKLEMGGEKLNLNYDDLIKYIEYLSYTFNDAAVNRGIDFTFESEYKQLYIYFDKSKIQKIMNNLYSNALKFTPNDGHISTIITLIQENEREYVKIEISDTGCGIKEQELATIFERFYQSNKSESMIAGSGIGLHMVKEYVLLHEGNIHVSSKINEGSIFSIRIPTDLKGEKPSDIQSVFSEVSVISVKQSTRKTILIVEDNTEFRRFLAEQLSTQFNMLEAGDGEQGEDLAIKKSPDLIISDLMMPKLNGLELCKRLKTNIQTSHIPIILLTARLSDEAKIDSYKAGADSYISKPFNFEVLLTRVQMLIKQQEKRKELFHKTIEITPSSITTTSLDEELVRKALQMVEKNISNTEYSVDELSLDIGLSRSRLYRKLESITGLSPNEFIRSIRLKRAAQLLKDSQYNISEIADRVGFNTIKYFNKHFKEEFGRTPSQYRTTSPNT
ncbi:Sensor histidine kinase TmoS [termite gut metagenome]|uniref:histidine kinase n=1 Tax=termite gut metagenome TaxID=433724 RepID=A0A5J4SX64_9ZZZZ